MRARLVRSDQPFCSLAESTALVDDEEGRAFGQARAPGWGPYPEAQGLPKGAVVVLDHAGAVGQK